MLTFTERGMPELLWAELKIALSKNFEEEIIFLDQNMRKSDVHFEFNYDKKNSKLLGKFNVLILHEPESVIPIQYKTKVLKKFQLVLPMGIWRSRNLLLDNWILHPRSWSAEDNLIQTIEDTRNRNLVMVNGNKFSANKKSLYGLRRKLSKNLFKLEVGFDLYGQNWQMSKTKELKERIWAIRKEISAFNFPSFKEAFSEFTYRYPGYKGPVDDKYNLLTKYKFALIIENEADYITEKIFDAIYSKCVPLYIGPDLKELKDLNNCIVHISPSAKSIATFLKSDFTDEYLNKKRYIEYFINNSNEIDLFSMRSIADKIAAYVKTNYN
jgi:hypothetical protein